MRHHQVIIELDAFQVGVSLNVCLRDILSSFFYWSKPSSRCLILYATQLIIVLPIFHKSMVVFTQYSIGVHIIPFCKIWFAIGTWILSWICFTLDEVIIKIILLNLIFFKIPWTQNFLTVILAFLIIPSTTNIYVPRKGFVFIDWWKENVDGILWVVISGNFSRKLKVLITRVIIVVPIVTGNILRLIAECFVCINGSFPFRFISRVI